MGRAIIDDAFVYSLVNGTPSFIVDRSVVVNIREILVDLLPR